MRMEKRGPYKHGMQILLNEPCYEKAWRGIPLRVSNKDCLNSQSSTGAI